MSAQSYSVNASCYYNRRYLEFRVTDMTTHKSSISKKRAQPQIQLSTAKHLAEASIHLEWKTASSLPLIRISHHRNLTLSLRHPKRTLVCAR